MKLILVLVVSSCIVMYANAQCRCDDYQIEDQCDEERCNWKSGSCADKMCEDIDAQDKCLPVFVSMGTMSLEMDYVEMISSMMNIKRCYWNASDEKCTTIKSCADVKLETYNMENCGKNLCSHNEDSNVCENMDCADFGSFGICSEGFVIDGDSYHGCEEVDGKCQEKKKETSCSDFKDDDCESNFMFPCQLDAGKCIATKCEDAENEDSCKAQQELNGECVWAEDKCHYVKIFPLTEVDCGSLKTKEICNGTKDSPCYWDNDTCNFVENCSQANCKDKTDEPVQQTYLKGGIDFGFCKGDGSACKDHKATKAECIEKGEMFMKWDGSECVACVYTSGSVNLFSLVMTIMMMLAW